jgi:type IV secretion system protein VirB9
MTRVNLPRFAKPLAETIALAFGRHAKPLLVLAAISAAMSASILPAPASAQDPRLVEVVYDPSAVTVVRGRVKVQATIMFGDNESIENVAIGDSQAWQVTPNKQANLLFVKPLATRAATNMTVVTSKRTYLFDLVASPRSRPVYVVKFNYPDEPEAEAMPAPAIDERTAIERQASSDPRAVLDPAALNFEWEKSGDTSLLPARVFDDGQAVFLTWPAGQAVPAILISDGKGKEGPVNFTVRGDTVVVDGAPRQIVLRSGRDKAELNNRGPLRPLSTEREDSTLASAEMQ